MLDIEHCALGLQFHNLRQMHRMDCERADLYSACLLAADALNLADRFAILRHVVGQFKECLTLD